MIDSKLLVLVVEDEPKLAQVLLDYLAAKHGVLKIDTIGDA